MKIAVLMNEEGVAANFSEQAGLFVYERVSDDWVCEHKYAWVPYAYHTMEALRKCLGDIAVWLGDCRVIAARRSNGYYRVVFEGLSVAMWAVEGYPQDFIPQIERFYKDNDRRQTGDPADIISPITGKAGFYSVDLRKVMAHHEQCNSRDVLLPFFQKASFQRLEIVCDHVPKWFKIELPLLKLRADVEAQGSIMKVHVYGI